MTSHARPVVVVSKCLEFAACRYNGQTIRAPLVSALAKFAELRAVCPEVEIGLGMPRDPIRIVSIGGDDRLIQPTTGRDVTDAIRAFGGTYLSQLGAVDGFILKGRSPSCGLKDVKRYATGARATPVGTGPGLFGLAVLDAFPDAAIEDEGRLTNFRLRHHWLTKLFLWAAWRDVERRRAMGALVRFHADIGLLLMAYHPAELRVLGRVVANAQRRPIGAALTDYRDGLARALARPARPTSHINVLRHGMGCFTKHLSAAERAHFLDALAEYQAGRLALHAPLAVLRSWVARFDETSLATQRYFSPYPRELLDLRGS